MLRVTQSIYTSARARQLQETQSPSCASFRHMPYRSFLTTWHGLQRVAKHSDVEGHIVILFHATKDCFAFISCSFGFVFFLKETTGCECVEWEISNCSEAWSGQEWKVVCWCVGLVLPCKHFQKFLEAQQTGSLFRLVHQHRSGTHEDLSNRHIKVNKITGATSVEAH